MKQEKFDMTFGLRELLSFIKPYVSLGAQLFRVQLFRKISFVVLSIRVSSSNMSCFQEKVVFY